MSNNVTPFVKRMRVQGGTMYTFSSAVEDIGLNINERNNIVKMSNFALLDIPECEAPSNVEQNRFNILGIPGAFKNHEESNTIKDGKVVIAESFQNYALNLESNLLNLSTYNPALSNTVSEKVFWKWLKESGAIRWIKDTNSPGYFLEETDTDLETAYKSVVKYVGEISAGSVRTDNFGTYNETYILVPSSHGQTQVYFKQTYDDNYRSGQVFGSEHSNILGREDYSQPHPDGLSILAQYDVATDNDVIGGYNLSYDKNDGFGPQVGWWYTGQGIATSAENYVTDDVNIISNPTRYNYTLKYDGTESVEFKRSNIDALELEFNINKLRDIWNGGTGEPSLTYDKMAIDYSIDDKFDFNAVLVYYSVYNQSLDKVLSTNLLGILFLDAATGNTAGFPNQVDIEIPEIIKIQSNGTGFGSSYSFRINIKSDNMFDDTQAVIYDESTSSQNALENWTDVFANLEKSLSILNQHTDTVNYITNQYIDMASIQTQQGNQISSLQYQVNDTVQDIKGVENVVPLFSDGNDPLIESSIYMRHNKIGFFTNDPQSDFDLNGDMKVKDIYLENSINDKDSENIISFDANTLKIGSKTINRDIEIYDDNPNPLIFTNYTETIINSITLNVKNLNIDGSLNIDGDVYVTGEVEATDFQTISDIRLKEDIKNINIDKEINNVEFKEFYFKKDETKRKRYGVIAQDLEIHFPEMVQEDAVGFKSVSYIDLLIAKYAELEKRVKQLEK